MSTGELIAAAIEIADELHRRLQRSPGSDPHVRALIAQDALHSLRRAVEDEESRRDAEDP